MIPHNGSFLQTVYEQKSTFTIGRNRTDSNCSPVTQVTCSITLNEMQFSDCKRTKNCLYDLSYRTNREAVFPDRLSLSNHMDREAVFSDHISLSNLCTNRTDCQTIHPEFQVTRSILHSEMKFSDCIWTEN